MKFKKLKTLSILVLAFGAGNASTEFFEKYYHKQIMGRYITSMDGEGPTRISEFRNNNPVTPKFGQQQDFSSIVDAEENLSAVVLKDGEIIFERYNDELDIDSNFFIQGTSLTKTLMSSVVGHLICEGSIKSIDETVGLHSKSLSSTVYKDVTIRNLLQMNSGVNKNRKNEKRINHQLQGKFEEFGDLSDQIQIIKVIKNRFEEQGNRFSYHTLDSAAISVLVSELTGKSVAEIFYDEVFSKMDASNDLYWWKDINDMSMGFSGAYMTTRDWAKFGQFISNNINNKTCLGDYFLSGIENSIDSDSKKQGKYGYHFWVPKIAGKPMVELRGFGGNDMVINHYDNTVAVVASSSKNSKYGNRNIRREVMPSIINSIE